MDQNSERAFGVNTKGHPVLVLKRHRPGTGTLLYNMHVDRDSAGAEYDLVCQWWNGQAWETSVIDDTREYRYVRPKVRVDRHDNIWVFIGDSKFPSVNPRYTVSRDGGRTWAPWQSFGEPGTRVQRPFTYVDPIDPDTHYIFWSDFSTDRVKFVKIQLTMQNP